MLDSLMEHFVNSDGEEYIGIRDLVGDKMLEMLAIQTARQNSVTEASEETVEKILALADHLYMKFPSIDSETPDLPEIDPDEVNVDDQIDDIQSRLFKGVVRKSDEEFPILIDIFRVEKITFAYELAEKEESLSDTLDWLVEKENYEEAAKIRDLLEEMGSNKVK